MHALVSLILTESVIGFVFHVARYIDGNIELDFLDMEKNEKVTYSTKNGLSHDIATALVDSLGRNIWTKLEFDNGKFVSVSFEEYNFERDVYKLKEKLERVWPGYLERI